jgi:hypothetical protein
MINEKPQLINEYESGKAIPNPQVRSLARCAFSRRLGPSAYLPRQCCS